MTGRLQVLCLPLLLATGCVEPRTRLVSGGPMPSTPVPSPRSERLVSKAPATEATAQRVLALGQKIVVANPQLGFRPLFVTVGTPGPEIFHRGGQLDGYSVFVSEGLVNRCRDDAQLAAVLCLELGKIVSEREALAGPASRLVNDRPPPAESIGSDAGGPFGPPDGTRMMELAKYDRHRRRPGSPPLPPPPPDVLARHYLARAGFDAAALTDAAPLLRQAEDHCTIEQQLGESRR